MVSPSQLKIEEQEFLRSFLTDKKRKIAVEVGSYGGGTAVIIAEYVDLVVSIDIAWLGGLPEHDKIKPIIADSKEALDMVKTQIAPAQKIDFLFIDGDHTYEGVKRDWEIYSPLVKKGGVVMFHDILDTDYHRAANCYVANFWNEIQGSDNFPKTHEFIAGDTHWGGLGWYIQQ